MAYGTTGLWIGRFLGAGTTALTAARLLYFYTTFCGLTPIEATFIFAMARVLDAVISPLMGFLTDNFGSTAGQALWPPQILYSARHSLRIQLQPDVGRRDELSLLPAHLPAV